MKSPNAFVLVATYLVLAISRSTEGTPVLSRLGLGKTKSYDSIGSDISNDEPLDPYLLDYDTSRTRPGATVVDKHDYRQSFHVATNPLGHGMGAFHPNPFTGQGKFDDELSILRKATPNGPMIDSLSADRSSSAVRDAISGRPISRHVETRANGNVRPKYYEKPHKVQHFAPFPTGPNGDELYFSDSEDEELPYTKLSEETEW